MQRRQFLWLLGGGTLACQIGCHERGCSDLDEDDRHKRPDAATPNPDAHPGDAGTPPTPDACPQATVKMHDTEAQALYLDGSLGPLTGTIRVGVVMAGTAVTLDFWHGHGGVQHRFTLTPAMLDDLKQGKKITAGTTTVDNHAHTLFIDPKDERYRTPGAPDVMVDLGCA